MEARYPKVLMFQELELGNFRGFRSEEAIKFAPLTFIVGPNSSGKSSVFDAILFIIQSYFWQFDKKTPVWIGELVDLGSFIDTVYQHDRTRAVRIGLTLPFAVMHGAYRKPRDERDWRRSINLNFKLRKGGELEQDYLEEIVCTDVASGVTVKLRNTPKRTTDPKAEIDGMKVTSIKDVRKRQPSYAGFCSALREAGTRTLSQNAKRFVGKRPGVIRILDFLAAGEHFTFWHIFMTGTQRVASGRAAPKRWYPLGAQGRRAGTRYRSPLVLDSVEPSILEPPEYGTLPFYPRQRRFTKKDLERILNSLRIAGKVAAASLSPYHSTIQVTDSVTKVSSKLIDVGYGASQVIPVIAACLSDFPGALFVEQPEIHLHPSAQGVVAELLVETSKQRQVVVETHSEHLINRARIMVAKGEIHHEDVIINYVDRNRDGSYVKRIPLNANGDFEAEWPEGFFDERYHDTVQLMRLKKRSDE